ncbi:MAG: enoyl-CoA hydratase/isomerase family protein [Methylobacteriaceae bacterium]|nr:enoyl-CoA hydratase/isomerase family protein [Methylobacteriaceae bacterium]
MSKPEIICERRGASGTVFFSRPQALNAITLNMVRELTRALDEWERDPAIKNVVVTAAASKAFSAGGDIRLLYEQGQAGDHAAQLDFWRWEYQLNRRIRLYPKPYVALVDGIVMGGGVGVSLHGSHRIAGEKFSFAMPEVGIGFFPDVGATYFLPRLPGEAGMYFALTGGRANAGDAAHLGLASAYVLSTRFDELADALGGGERADDAVARLRSDISPGPIVTNRALVDRCFSASGPAKILERLDAESSPFAAEAAKAMREKAPLSLEIAYRQMSLGAKLSIDEAMQTEFRVVSRVCRGSDFYEGIRATIIDKDFAPRWSHTSLDKVHSREVDSYFAPLGASELTFENINARETVS